MYTFDKIRDGIYAVRYPDEEDNELYKVFHPLASEDATLVACSRRKARNWERDDHPSWLRLYTVKLESGVYVITGGAIKMARKMQSERATDRELQKLNEIRQYFLDKGVLKITESQ